MDKIEKRLDRLEEKVDMILKILTEDIKKNCEKMGGHINFVEKVYDNVKHPLTFICNKVNYLSGLTSGEEIKQLDDK